jgi:hypothetical protein
LAKGTIRVRRSPTPKVAQEADPVHLPRLLRLGGERRGEESSRTNNKGAPIHYSIT